MSSFYNFYAANFLGDLDGPPSDLDNRFAVGGNYHYNLAPLPSSSDKDYLTLNYLEDVPSDGNLGESLIGQLGDQYVTPKRELENCDMVTQGRLVLVESEEEGKTQDVTITNAYSSDEDHIFSVNVEPNSPFSYFQFYSCDSSYMGYKQDGKNYYGHLQLGGQEDGDCFQRWYNMSGPTTEFKLDNKCSNIDDASQLQQWFHLAVTSEGYEVNYLNATATTSASKAAVKAESSLSFGWTTYENDNVTEVILNPNPSSSNAKNYKLRFSD